MPKSSNSFIGKRLAVCLSVTALLAAAFLVRDVAGRYALHLRHRMQEHFAEIHAALHGDDEDEPFADNGISPEEIRARDNITAAIATPDNALKWEILAQADTTVGKDGIVQPVFTAEIRKLDHKILIAKGYMFPLDAFGKQTHFLLSPYPPSCPFCLPAGPNELIEIIPDDPMKFTYDPVTVKGKFDLLQSDEQVKQGMFYRMENATAVGE